MREFLVLLVLIFLGVNSAFAYDLVLPKEKKSVTSNNYAFFVGKANSDETLIINDEKTAVTLKLSIDTTFCAVMDYFEIFMARMILCRKAAERRIRAR